jgi:hypothetical protein
VDSAEIGAKAIIAAALITSHAVEVPRLSMPNDASTDAAARRLRELTNYVYRSITGGPPES